MPNNNIDKLQIHQLGNIFPKLDSDKFNKLKQSIKQLGLLEPIALLDNKILDGKERYRACLALKIAPRTIAYQGDNALAFVAAKNANRRHLTIGQRVSIADKLATKEGKGRPKKGEQVFTLSQAAEVMLVSATSIKEFRRLPEHLRSDVAAGTTTLNYAKFQQQRKNQAKRKAEFDKREAKEEQAKSEADREQAESKARVEQAERQSSQTDSSPTVQERAFQSAVEHRAKREHDNNAKPKPRNNNGHRPKLSAGKLSVDKEFFVAMDLVFGDLEQAGKHLHTDELYNKLVDYNDLLAEFVDQVQANYDRVNEFYKVVAA